MKNIRTSAVLVLVFAAIFAGSWVSLDAAQAAFAPSSMTAEACGSTCNSTPTCTLTASPANLTQSGNVTLTWDSTNAGSGSIDNGVGALGGSAGYISAYVSQTTTFTATFSNASGKTGQCHVTVTLTPPPTDVCPNISGVQTSVPAGMVIDSSGNCVTPQPQTGCIQVLKEEFDPNGTKLTPVAQFSFKLDGGTTIQNDANGNATFTNVPVGTHQVTEVSAGPTWKLLSVTPASGNVVVGAGPTCAAVTFKNQQVVTSNPQPSCTLSASPSALTASGSTTLTWTSANATSASIDHGIGTVTPVAGGSVSSPSISASTTFTMTVTGPGGTQTCSAPVTVSTGTNPACTLSLSASSIASGGSVVLSWTSANVSSGSIDNNVGSVSPVSAGSTTVYPPSSTTFTGTFTGPNGTITCSIPLTVTTSGCSGSCGGGGGYNQPNVALYNQPNQQPLAFVSLSQIPYTGFEAGPALTMIFWLAIALLSALIAYGIVGKSATHYALAYVLGTAAGIPVAQAADPSNGTTGEDAHEGYGRAYPAAPQGDASGTYIHASVAAPALAMPIAMPAAPAATHPAAPVAAHVSGIIDIIETRAHAAGVLLSPEAAANAAALSTDREATLRMFGAIIEEAVRTVPREDGWIILTADKLREISSKDPAAVSASIRAASSAGDPASAFAGAIASSDRENAFSIIRSLEHDGTNPTALMTATATVFDTLYRARQGGHPAPDLVFADKAAHVSNAQLERLIAIFTHALDHVYASPFTGVKLALAQAFEVLG